jgi:capsular polysaccharide biosynthesis protein
MGSALRRRGWVVVLATLCVALLAYAVSEARGASFSAEGVAVVVSDRTVTPDQANALALTYAVLIPKDAAITDYVARRLHTTQSDVGHRLSVANDPTTAILHVGYRAATTGAAVDGVRFALQAVTTAQPVSANIAPGSVQVVTAPLRASASNRTGYAVVVGAILGLALGVILLVTWERTDPRIDDAEGLGTAVGAPVSALEATAGTGAATLLRRWASLVGSADGAIALAPLTPDVERTVTEVAARLRVRTRRASSGERGGPKIVALGYRVLPTESDAMIVVARRGSRTTDVRATLDDLSSFGVSPTWAILLPAGDAVPRPPRVLGRRRRERASSTDGEPPLTGKSASQTAT